MNVFNDIEIICWGELRNKDNIQKICLNIVEAQQEIWSNQNEFFNAYIDQSKFKYYLIINDKCEIISPQDYFIKTINIFNKIQHVCFVYSDYNNVLLPSFKPFLFRDQITNIGFPIIIKNISNKLHINNIKEDYLIGAIRTLTTNLIGYHIAESLINIYE